MGCPRTVGDYRKVRMVLSILTPSRSLILSFAFFPGKNKRGRTPISRLQLSHVLRWNGFFHVHEAYIPDHGELAKLAKITAHQ